MAAPPESRGVANPWPEWPLVFRTSSSQEEGGERVFSRRTTMLEGEGGKLTALRWVDSQNPANEERVEVDLLIQAMGFVGPVVTSLKEQLGVELDARGNVKVDAKFRTSVPGVFAVGDAKRGASLIVWAIAEGRDAAKFVL